MGNDQHDSEDFATKSDNLRLAYDLARVFVISQPGELGVTEMVSACPLQKLDTRNRFRFQPQCRMPDYAA